VRFVVLDAGSVGELLDSATESYKGDFWTATVGLNFTVF
jgi:hypothetical protein